MDNDNQTERFQRRRESLLTVVFVSMACIGILFFLNLITCGFFIYVIPVLGGIAGFTFLNYILWGRGLMQATAGEREEEELRASMERQPWELSETEQPRHL